MPQVQGTAHAVNVRTGNKNGQDWCMTTVRVLEDDDLTDVLLGDRMDVPQKGAPVAYTVKAKANVFRGTASVEFAATTDNSATYRASLAAAA